MSKVRIADVVSRYNGDGDVVVWLDRLEVVARLQQESNLENLIPLFLEGAAYDVYAKMAAEDKTNLTKLKATLKKSFGMTPALAFAKFKGRSLMAGEAPDAFLAELRRLARTVAADGNDNTIDAFVCCQFVDGLPEPTRSQVRAIRSDDAWSVNEVLGCAKAMLLQREVAINVDGGGFVGGVTRDGRAVETTPGAAIRSEGSQRMGPKCAGCSRWGHVRSDCRVRCFRCHGVGHLKRNCEAEFPGQGNDHRGAV